MRYQTESEIAISKSDKTRALYLFIPYLSIPYLSILLNILEETFSIIMILRG